MESRKGKKNQDQNKLSGKELIEENKKIITKIINDVKETPMTLNPHPNRIICHEHVQGSIKIGSGLEQSTSYQAGAKKDQQMELVRYFIIAIGDNAKGLSFGGKKMEKGDELIHCLVPTVVRAEMPLVTDYGFLDDEGKIRHFASFDIAEVHAIIKQNKIQ